MAIAVTLKLPLLSRLLLGELAERRGITDEVLLTDLIRREAVAELDRSERSPASRELEAARAGAAA